MTPETFKVPPYDPSLRLVDRLERENLVRREPDPEDGRATCAVLTPAGRERLGEAHPTHAAGIRRYFLAHLSDAEQRTLGEIWRRVLGAPGVRENGKDA